MLNLHGFQRLREVRGFPAEVNGVALGKWCEKLHHNNPDPDKIMSDFSHQNFQHNSLFLSESFEHYAP